MENELAVIEGTQEMTMAQAQQIDRPKPPSLHAVAVNATEMKEANEEIREAVVRKLEALQAEAEDVGEARFVAQTNNWATATLARVESKLLKQIEYYGKLLLALDAGYTLVPNMPCDQFAIRVKRQQPAEGMRHNESHYGYSDPRVPEEREQILQPGEGRYKSPAQLLRRTQNKEVVDAKTTKYHVTLTPTEFDAIEFPLAAAVPVVMTATQAAMALKLFDRIGLVPQQVQRNADPIVLGQICWRHGGVERVTSFLIAWHLDLRTL